TLNPLFENKKQHFSLEKKTPLPKVIGDAEKLRQILINLLNNAIKFTDPHGCITLKAELWTGKPPAGLDPLKHYISVSIEDSGIGIKPEDLERLFDEFIQLDASASRKYGGTGLGLSITKRLVDMHHGIIQVSSRYGEGSIFSFFIPVDK
ncbi:MAG: hypothetical protein KAI69_07905, partial [Deltaproteobacteria bacterium]|nr:hypothetical protein [Deltaproteobacteria bacterium]